MAEEDEVPRLYAKDVGVDPPIGGNDNVQDVLTVGGIPVGFPVGPHNDGTRTYEVDATGAITGTPNALENAISLNATPLDLASILLTAVANNSEITMAASDPAGHVCRLQFHVGTLIALFYNAIEFLDYNDTMPDGLTLAAGTGGIGLKATKLGLYTAPPAVQPVAIPAPAGGITVDAEARTAIGLILAAIGQAAGGIGITA